MFPHNSKEEVQFDEPLPGVPKSLIQGTHWIKSRLQGTLAFSSAVEEDSITTEGFSLLTSDPQGNDLFCNWMILPEPENFWIDRGTETKGDLSRVDETRLSFQFQKFSYTSPPVVCCWFTQIETVKDAVHTKLDVSIVVDSVTKDGFDLIVRTAAGTRRL